MGVDFNVVVTTCWYGGMLKAGQTFILYELLEGNEAMLRVIEPKPLATRSRSQ